MPNIKEVRRPYCARRLGLGVAMDLPWGASIGFCRDPRHGDHVTAKVTNFLKRYQDVFRYLIFAFQPRNRDRLCPQAYFAAYDTLFEAASAIPIRAFHHTLLNMGSLEQYDRYPVLDFTNTLIERYDFRWVVEDLGIWSVMGKSLPYPLPPVLTEEGLQASIRNVNLWQDGLRVPLSVEFPGFTEGASFYIGDMDAFDFFRIVAEQTGSSVTIDVGHILSYQWLQGRTGKRKYDRLSALPLAHCHELHLSGCQISGGKYRDLHHGVLLDEQIDLLGYFLQHCPHLRAVTYEDPQYSNDGVLVPKSLRNFDRMREMVAAWVASEDTPDGLR